VTTVPRVGAEIAGYRLESVIARGGMSTVFLAEHLRLARPVALKILSLDLSEDDTFRERFVRESKIAAGLDHPNIIPIYEAGESDGLLFIAMRYVQGSHLKALVEKVGPLPARRLLPIMSQTASALDAAHAKGLIHRDVKPGNILIDADLGPEHVDHVYLCDFGLTKRGGSHSGLTRTGQFVGTIDYIAPEQIEGGEVDSRADIYSLGCVLYECLTGMVPFEKPTDAAVLWAHVQENPAPPSGRRPDLPVDIDGVMARAMAKAPDDRYQTCAELVSDLRRSLGGTRAGPDPSETVFRSIPAVVSGRSSRNLPAPPPAVIGSRTTPYPPTSGEDVDGGSPKIIVLGEEKPQTRVGSGAEGGGPPEVTEQPRPSTKGGRKSSSVWPRSDRVGVALAAAVGLLVGAVSGWAIAQRGSSGSSDTGILYAELRDHIPTSYVDTCEEAPRVAPAGTNLVPGDIYAVARCTGPDGIDMTFYLLHAPAAMQTAFYTLVASRESPPGSTFTATQAAANRLAAIKRKTLGEGSLREIPAGATGSCETSWATGVADVWSRMGSAGHAEGGDTPSGLVACYQDPADSKFTWVWTDNQTPAILAIAKTDQAPDALSSWWKDSAGPVVNPSTPGM